MGSAAPIDCFGTAEEDEAVIKLTGPRDPNGRLYGNFRRDYEADDDAEEDEATETASANPLATSFIHLQP